MFPPLTTSTIAVADGVGGWESKGVNPRAFADELLTKTYQVLKEGIKHPKSAITVAYPLLSEIGSATICMGKMEEDGIFSVANIGDSGFIIIRDGAILIESSEHQHHFNYPYQLGIGMDGLPHGQDRPKDAEVYQLKLEEGDVVVMGTDGLLDNLWPKEILDYVEKHPRIREHCRKGWLVMLTKFPKTKMFMSHSSIERSKKGWNMQVIKAEKKTI